MVNDFAVSADNWQTPATTLVSFLNYRYDSWGVVLLFHKARRSHAGREFLHFVVAFTLMRAFFIAAGLEFTHQNQQTKKGE